MKSKFLSLSILVLIFAVAAITFQNCSQPAPLGSEQLNSSEQNGNGSQNPAAPLDTGNSLTGSPQTPAANPPSNSGTASAKFFNTAGSPVSQTMVGAQVTGSIVGYPQSGTLVCIDLVGTNDCGAASAQWSGLPNDSWKWDSTSLAWKSVYATETLWLGTYRLHVKNAGLNLSSVTSLTLVGCSSPNSTFWVPGSAGVQGPYPVAATCAVGTTSSINGFSTCRCGQVSNNVFFPVK